MTMVRLRCMLEEQFSRLCLALYVLYPCLRLSSRSPQAMSEEARTMGTRTRYPRTGDCLIPLSLFRFPFA